MIAFSFLLNFGAFLKFPQGSGHLPSALFHKAKMLSSHISRTAFVESGPEEGVEAPANCLRSRFAVVGVVPIVSPEPALPQCGGVLMLPRLLSVTVVFFLLSFTFQSNHCRRLCMYSDDAKHIFEILLW